MNRKSPSQSNSPTENQIFSFRLADVPHTLDIPRKVMMPKRINFRDPNPQPSLLFLRLCLYMKPLYLNLKHVNVSFTIIRINIVLIYI